MNEAKRWNWMAVEPCFDDSMMRPMIGPGDLTRTDAHAEVQRTLDRVAALYPHIPQVVRPAAVWRRGAKDDTLTVGGLIWCLYQHPAGEDPRRAAIDWLGDLAAIMRTAGANVQVAAYPRNPF